MGKLEFLLNAPLSYKIKYMTNIIITSPEEMKGLIRRELSEFAHQLKNTPSKVEDRWLDMNELLEYLPGSISKSTIYGYVSKRSIPVHKSGKRLAFLQSEIDLWLKSKRLKTTAELEQDAFHMPSKTNKGNVK